ncbi:ribosomal RNA-processing protein 8 [Phaethornis superciliosus]
MFAEEEEWNDGAESLPRDRRRPRIAPQGPGRPTPAGNRRRRPGDGAVKDEEEPAGKRTGTPRPSGTGESRQRPEGAVPAELPGAPGRRPNRRQRRNKLKKEQQHQEAVEEPQEKAVPEPPAPCSVPVPVPADRSESLRARMEERLLGARFRYLNQQLYSSSSREAARLFQSDPEAFRIYHRGFARQVARWPQNPVDRIIRYLRQRPPSLVVADFGCGDCKLACGVRNRVHCFDLLPLSPRVTVCDMAQVPLAAESVDVAVFCLALMGTNLQEILEEANRVLKPGGTLLVAEVASRFEDTRGFISAMAQLGFKSVSKDLSSSFFYLLEFSKTGPPRPKPAPPTLRLRPCLYKRR